MTMKIALLSALFFCSIASHAQDLEQAYVDQTQTKRQQQIDQERAKNEAERQAIINKEIDELTPLAVAAVAHYNAAAKAQSYATIVNWQTKAVPTGLYADVRMEIFMQMSNGKVCEADLYTHDNAIRTNGYGLDMAYSDRYIQLAVYCDLPDGIYLRLTKHIAPADPLDAFNPDTNHGAITYSIDMVNPDDIYY